MATQPQTKEERWLDDRRKCITATDIGAIVGLNNFKSPHSVWEEKLGLAPIKEDNEAMEWGRRLEPVIIDKMMEDDQFEEYRIEPISYEVMLHPVDPWCGATPDGLVWSTDPDPGIVGVLEAKTANINAGRNFGEQGTDYVPDHYHLQTQWQMFCTGAQFATLGVLIGGNDYRQYEIKRNEELIRRLHHQASIFWHEYVLKEVPPPVTGKQADTDRLKALLPKAEPGKVVTADFELEVMLEKMPAFLEALRKAEEDVDQVKNLVMAYMGDAESMETMHGRITWKNQDPRTDWKTVAASLRKALELSDADFEVYVATAMVGKNGPRVLRLPFRNNQGA